MKLINNGRFNYSLTGVKVLGSVLVATLLGHWAQADVRMPNVFSDNMVLQQGMSVPVWGWADEGETILVQCQGQRVTTVARGGKWMVRLNNLKVATADAPETLTIDGKNRIRFQNVLVGEVWLCSGQSNMEWPLSRSFEPQKDIAESTNPNIRLFTVKKTKADAPLDDVPVEGVIKWLECKPFNVPSFSAVGYYFGRALQQARQVPVGLIHTSWGGSPAEVWMSREALAANPAYLIDILDKSEADLKKFKEAEAAWRKEAEELKKAGQKAKPAPRAPWIPSQLYNGMLAPLAPFAVKGAIWYQGESNAGRAYQYRTLFPDMIKNWRATWGQNEFYFMTVQLAPFDPSLKGKTPEPGDSNWAELREAQLLANKLPGVGMAVITDVGDPNDIHPTKKAPVGERLALAARGIAYKEKGLVYSGPVFKKLSIRKNEAVLTFDHVGDGLEARGGDLKGFAICGADRKWVWGKAVIGGKKGDEVIVTHPDIAKPVAVRYGWANYPEVNLWNKNGLPATPFRTDDFPMITAPKPASGK